MFEDGQRGAGRLLARLSCLVPRELSVPGEKPLRLVTFRHVVRSRPVFLTAIVVIVRITAGDDRQINKKSS